MDWPLVGCWRQLAALSGNRQPFEVKTGRNVILPQGAHRLQLIRRDTEQQASDTEQQAPLIKMRIGGGGIFQSPDVQFALY